MINSKSVHIYAFYYDFSDSYGSMFKIQHLRYGSLDLQVLYTIKKLIKRSNSRQVYFAQRRNKHPASASHCDSCASWL